MIVFYRGGWCPYCNIALRTYQAQLVRALTDRNTPLVAISPQTPDGSLSTKETKDLTFTVLSDPGCRIPRVVRGPRRWGGVRPGRVFVVACRWLPLR